MLGADLVNFFSEQFSVISISKQNYSQHLGEYFDVLVNANGNSKRYWADNNPLKDFDASTLSVYKSIFDFKFTKYVYLSSSDVYEDHTNIENTKEEQQNFFHNLSPYGFHKYLSEQIIKNFSTDYLILRSSLILGSRLKKGPMYDLLNQIPLFISLDSQLQMITTVEIAKVIKFLLRSNKKNEIYNLGGKGTVNFRNIEVYTKIKPMVAKEARKQTYEMNINKLDKIFPLKKSTEYLVDYLNERQ